MNALVISNSSMIRAKIIADRTGSEFMAGAKSVMIAQLKEKMRNGIAHFLFLKKDGSIREAWGTTNKSLVEKYTNGRGDSRELFCTTAFFDVEKSEFRSFRWENLIQVF